MAPRALPLLVAAALALAGPAISSGQRASRDAGSTFAQDVCPTPRPGYAQCFSKVISHRTRSGSAAPRATAAPQGYGPADLLSAYNLTSVSNRGAGQTIAIVDAFDNPNAEADLKFYRSQFGLPPCTTANGCFHKVGQTGGSPPATTNANWGVEISLDLDMASAICPRCDITLVEANSNSLTNLAAAASFAKSNFPIASNSYGLYERLLTPAQLTSARSTFGPSYRTTAGQVLVSTGDDGFGAAFPADLQFVNAIGGTTLRKRPATARGWTESAWSGTGSGCTLQTPRPAWEPALADCTKRAESDTSAVADPSTGVAVRDTFGAGGWLVVGGTSASTPIIAGVYGLAGNAATIQPFAHHLYLHAGSFYDITSGRNGSCGGSELCTSGPGWDGPTGLGTPMGLAAF